jgi:lysophospholipase L1-like esterase
MNSTKTVLCFGDSNTWGLDPVATAQAPRRVRHAADVRWTGVLRRQLGEGFHVIEEGQCGRTTVHDDPIEGPRNGRTYLVPCLESHQPLDAVILMLGSNDLKTRFCLPPGDIADSAALLVRLIQQSACGPDGGAPAILLVAPPAVADLSHLPEQAEKFAEAPATSVRLPALYARHAALLGCAFLDSQTVVTPSVLDGLHLEADEHAKLGLAIANALRRLF